MNPSAFFCSVGLHNWTRWFVPDNNDKVEGKYKKRFCCRCKEEQVK